MVRKAYGHFGMLLPTSLRSHSQPSMIRLCVHPLSLLQLLALKGPINSQASQETLSLADYLTQ